MLKKRAGKKSRCWSGENFRYNSESGNAMNFHPRYESFSGYKRYECASYTGEWSKRSSHTGCDGY